MGSDNVRLVYLQNWNIAVKKNGEVCFDCSVLKSLTPEPQC